MKTHETTTGCPCCGDTMPTDLVVCWTCYRLSDRLQAGRWPDGNGLTFVVTDEDIKRWDKARDKRSPFMTPSHWPSHGGYDRFGNEDNGQVGGCPTDTVGGL